MKIVLIGFGEAGQSIAAGLAKSSHLQIGAFDLRFSKDDGLALKQRAVQINVTAYDDLSTAIEGADVVFSLVVGSAAVRVGSDAAAFLRPGQCYVDLNSVSPNTKLAVATAIGESGAEFVEAAVMARVPPYGHKVPLLLAGAPAETLSKKLNELGMVTEAVGDTVGQASMNKLLRSVVVKGSEALLLEALTVARAYGIEERLLDSLRSDFIDADWRTIASYYLGRTAAHGARRITEMTEATDMLAEIGFEPIMAEAAKRRIAWGHEKLHNQAWKGDEPEDYREIIAASSEAMKRDSAR